MTMTQPKICQCIYSHTDVFFSDGKQQVSAISKAERLDMKRSTRSMSDMLELISIISQVYEHNEHIFVCNPNKSTN